MHKVERFKAAHAMEPFGWLPMNSRGLLLLIVFLMIAVLFALVPSRFLAPLLFRDDMTMGIDDTGRTQAPRALVIVPPAPAPVTSQPATSSRKTIVPPALPRRGHRSDIVAKPPGVGSSRALDGAAARAVPADMVVTLFDPLETVDQWVLTTTPNDRARLGLFRGLDGKAIALYYNVSSEGWSEVTRRGAWDFSTARGIRFACKVDGALGEVRIRIADAQGKAVEKKWNTDALSGSVWRILDVALSETDLSRAQISAVTFSVYAQQRAVQGRVLFDTIELVQR